MVLGPTGVATCEILRDTAKSCRCACLTKAAPFPTPGPGRIHRFSHPRHSRTRAWLLRSECQQPWGKFDCSLLFDDPKPQEDRSGQCNVHIRAEFCVRPPVFIQRFLDIPALQLLPEPHVELRGIIKLTIQNTFSHNHHQVEYLSYYTMPRLLSGDVTIRNSLYGRSGPL